MQRIEFRKIIASGILALALLATGAQAQDPAAGTTGTTQTQTDNDEGGMDMGWLGLLGLAGLLGLRKKDDHHVTRVDTTTGAGSTRARV
jgi:MYXO-CTERM domain-containing protein